MRLLLSCPNKFKKEGMMSLAKKDLRFSIGDVVYSAEPSKVDRAKLYGRRVKAALDDDDTECKLISMSECGTVCIPKGGTGLGYLSPEGNWVNRGQLNTVNLEGSPAELMPSSFNVVNILEEATPDDLLKCAVDSFYRLTAETRLIGAMSGKIFRFEYRYRDSYDTTSAFLQVTELNGIKELFMFVGSQHQFEPIGFEEVGIIDDSDVENVDDDADDELEFGF